MSLPKKDAGRPATRVALTANWITALRIIFYPPMIYFIMVGELWYGGYCFGAGMMLDALDGWWARRQGGVLDWEVEQTMSLWQRMNFRGTTRLGQLLDPAMDKLANNTGILMLGIGFVWLPLALLPPLIDLLLQFAVRPLKNWLNIGDAAANNWGKGKTWWQALAVTCMITFRQWPEGPAIASAVLGIAILFGCMSVYGHLSGERTARPFASGASDISEPSNS
ncbi:CDP-alcohol phosphatidyltransferase family protein [Patescibacteria group bacterium]